MADRSAEEKTAEGFVISKILGDNPSQEDFEKVFEKLREDGLSAGEAQLQVRAPMMILNDAEGNVMERMNEALKKVYDIDEDDFE